METLLSDTPVPCRYSQLGCAGVIPFGTLENHLPKCRYQPFGCPQLETCPWKGSGIMELISHLTSVHSADLVEIDLLDAHFVERYGNSEGIRLARWDPTLLKLVNADFDGLFMLNFLHQANGNFAACVRGLVRPRENSDASQAIPSEIVCEIFVSRGRRKLSWTGPVRDFHYSVDSIARSGDCLTILPNLALFFSDNECVGSEPIHQLSLEVSVSFQFIHEGPQSLDPNPFCP